MDLINIPGSYSILLFIALDFTSIASHIHTWVLFLPGALSSFFLELFLHSSPVVYWAPTDLGSSSFSVLSFCLFILSWGSQGRNTEGVCLLPFPVDHILSELSTMTHPSWVALHATAHSFIELDKAVVHVIRLQWWLCTAGASILVLLIVVQRRFHPKNSQHISC